MNKWKKEEHFIIIIIIDNINKSIVNCYFVQAKMLAPKLLEFSERVSEWLND